LEIGTRESDIAAMMPPAAERILEGLNPAQRAAVTHGEGPLLVVAGAGTGKTTVLTRRIAYLIAAKRARPEEILALTFTDKAAAEMEERVDLLVPYGVTDVWIGTFHAFGDRLLRDEALELGLSSDFRVLTRPEQALFFRERLFDFPLRIYRPLADPRRHIQALLQLISRAKDEDVSPEAYRAYAEALAAEAAGLPEGDPRREESARQAELAATYAAYQAAMAARGFLDFGDQVALALRLFRERPAVLARCRARFRYLLVDEFQDTNYGQWALVQLLAGEAGNLTVVGDDDQSIYKFRGAALDNLLGFRRVYPRATSIVLRENYRSTQAILDAAGRLVRHNDPDRLEVREGIDKSLVAKEASGRPPEHLHFDTLSSEADGVAGRIAELVAAGEATYREVAILVRANRDADAYLRALNMRGIPWRFSGNEGLYGRPEVRLLLAFLRALANPDDSLSLYALAGSDLYRMDPLELARCSAVAGKTHRALRWVLANLEAIADLADLSLETRATAAALLRDLRTYGQAALTHTAGEVCYRLLTESGWLKRLTARGAEAEAEVRNLARFFEVVRGYGAVAAEDRVAAFVAHLELMIEAGDDPAVAEADEGAEAVQVLTVHKAKGLEFPVVFLVGLVEQRFPSSERREPIRLPDGLLPRERLEVLGTGSAHLQEERRLFYVGMTRAKRRLFLTSARDLGGKRPRKVSRFVLEALDLPAAAPAAFRASALEAIGRNAPAAHEAPHWLRPVPDEAVLTLSHYQIDDYLTCPLKYKYVHVLRVPLRQHHSVVYGKALHEAVAAYLRARAAGRRLGLAQVLETFEAAWVNEGFLSREHEEQRRAAGRRALEQFVAQEEARGVAPAHVERAFSFHLGPDRVAGRWDRIDEVDGQVILRDYKSSEVRDQREADQKARESLQLSIYALAHRELLGRIPERVELHFLGSGLTGRSTRDGRDLEATVGQIKAVAEGLRRRDYRANPGYLQCGFCAFRDICPSTAYLAGGPAEAGP
jgi:DNA helicase-2/ATP-dependent DNA helicase PcrA